MARITTAHELYSVDIEFPGSVPEIGAGNAEETLELLASLIRPGSVSSQRASNEAHLPGPDLRPSQVPHSLCLDEDFEEKQAGMADRFSALQDKTHEVSKQLREALLRRGPLVSRASSRAECSTRAPSRATTLCTSRGGSRSSNRADGASSRLSSTRTGADSRLSCDRGDSRLSMRTDSRLSGRASVDSCMESLSCPPLPPNLGQSQRQEDFTDHLFPLPLSPQSEPSSPRREPSKPSRTSSKTAVLKRKERVNDDEFQAANRQKANSWIVQCNPHGVIHPRQKEPWVVFKEEREDAEMLKRKAFSSTHPWNFEDWLEDVKDVERAVFGCSRNRYEQMTKEANEMTQEESASVTLQRMSLLGYRGQVSKQDREMAQQVALARLRRSWPRDHNGEQPLKSFFQLADEVRNGKCTLAERRGHIVRLVSVVVFKVNYKGGILTDLGTWKNGKGTAAPRLPGRKIFNFEKVEDTIRQEIHTSLSPLQAGFEVGDIETMEYTEKSESVEVPTFYQKSCQHINIPDSFAFPPLPDIFCSEHPEVPPEFRQYRAFCLRKLQHLNCFAFLKPGDFDLVQRPEERKKPSGKLLVQKWMNHMCIDEATAMHDLSWTQREGASHPGNIAAAQSAGARKSSLLFGLKKRFKTVAVSEGPRQSMKKPIKIEEELQEGEAENVDDLKQTKKSIAQAARVLKTVIRHEMRGANSPDPARRATTKIQAMAAFDNVISQVQEQVNRTSQRKTQALKAATAALEKLDKS